MSVFCRSTTRCRSLATWSPWGGKYRDILILRGRNLVSLLEWEDEGRGTHFSFVFPTP